MAKDWSDPDDAPDLSRQEWRAKLAKARVKRGRPKLETPKVSTTIRLDAEVIKKFRAKGKGWQTEINAVLKEWLKKKAG